MKKGEALLTIGIFILLIFGFTVWNLLSPERTFAYNENRELQRFPRFSGEDLLSGEWQEDFEKYLSDQFPMRDAWVSAYVTAERAMQKKDVNSVFFGDQDYMIAMNRPNTVDPALAEKNLGRLEHFAEYFANRLGTEHTSIMLVPTAEAILTEWIPAGGTDMLYDQLGLLQRAKDRLDPELWIDAESLMREHKTEYIYYRTDHHWTMTGAFYAYQQWMEQKGYGEVKLEAYQQSVLSQDFLGTTFSKAPGWGIRPDTMLALDRKDPESYRLRLDQGSEIITGLYDMEKLGEKDKYAAYVYGNTAVTEIEGGERNGRILMIFKDSYAHSFATLAAADFERVYLVDPRYYQQDIWKFAEEKKVTDVLFLFNLVNFAQERNLYILDP